MAGIPDPKTDAFRLLESFCNVSRNDILINGDRAIASEELKSFLEAAEERKSRKPLQYITGTEFFMGLDFAVDERVLIPRADTEILVEEVLKDIHSGSRILDICTGSGCILISLLNYSLDCEGVGIDISDGALEVARTNASRLLSEDKKVTFLQGDLFEALDGCEEKFEIIVSNPPYIVSEEIEKLMPEVRDYEPRIALDGTSEGIVFYKRIVDGADRYLAGGGQIFFEIGYDQGEAVSELLKDAGYLEVKVIKDYAGLDRVVTGIKKVGK